MATSSKDDDITAHDKDPALSGKVKRNLHFWIAGLVAMMAVVVMTAQHLARKKPKPPPPVVQKAVVAPQLNALQDTISAQEALARKQAADASKQLSQFGDNALQLPPQLALPTLPQGNIPAPAPDPDAEDRRRAKEAAEATIRSSNIIAIEDGNAASSNADAAPANPTLNGPGEVSPLANGGRPADGRYADRGPRADAAHAKEQWYQDSQTVLPHPTPLGPESPTSPYTIFQGTTMPAVLITQINSTIPGMVTAMITSDVYDSINGNTLLIPRGTKLIGQYNNDVAYGDERIAVAFERMIYPSGVSVWLAGAPGADGMGQAGLADESTGHFLKLYGASLILGYINYSLDKHMQDSGSGSNTYIVSGDTFNNQSLPPGANPGSQIMYETSKRILDRLTAQAETIVIRQGFRFNVIVNRDMVLPPPETAKVY